MARTERLTVERVRELFDYNPETGDLVWKAKPSRTAHASKLGRRAGYLNTGHWFVVIDGVYYQGPRIAWMHYYGEVPPSALRFENGDASDMRLANIKAGRSVEGQFDHKTKEGRLAYQRAHRKAHKSHYRDKALQSTFGITLADYERMFADQGGKCAVCRNPETMHRWGKDTPMAVDHDHATGKVRGLICSACNQAIGLMKDDAARMESAARYLREHSGQSPSDWTVIMRAAYPASRASYQQIPQA